MLKQPTIEKLHALRLSVMAQSWEEQNRIPKVGDLSFDERFSMLVDAEYLARENRRLTRLLRDANLRIREACIEDVKAIPERGLPQAKLRQLAQGNWIGEHLNILITGSTGPVTLCTTSLTLRNCSDSETTHPEHGRVPAFRGTTVDGSYRALGIPASWR